MDSSQFLNLVSDNEKRKKELALRKEQEDKKKKLKREQEDRKKKLKLEKEMKALSKRHERERKQRIMREQGLAKAKQLINDPNMIGHKFCRDGQLKYIGLVNYVGRANWGSLTEKGQMQATLEGLSPDKKMAKLRSIGYAISGTLQYKNDTTPSLDGLSIPSGQVFWDKKSHWYSCPK